MMPTWSKAGSLLVGAAAAASAFFGGAAYIESNPVWLMPPFVPFIGSFELKAGQEPPGLDTHIDARPGQTLEIRANQRISYGYDDSSPDCSGNPQVNPDGRRFLGQHECQPKFDSNAMDPKVAIGVLLARVGDGQWFPVGSYYTTTIQPMGGRAFLLYNEAKRTDDNGAYCVSVTVH
jgi:hypothetical protein